MGNGNNETYEFLIVEMYKAKWNNENITFREILKRLHVDEGMSYRDMSKHFKVSLSTVYMWCKRENVLDKDMKW